MLSRALITLALILLTTLAVAEQAEESVTLSIPNMTCMSCEMRIDQALREVDGVVDTQFDLDAKTVTIQYNPAKTSIEALTGTTEAIGYPATVTAATS